MLAVAAAVALVWVSSDISATGHTTANRAAEPLRVPRTPPETMQELWRAPSPATPEPVASGASAVTADGGTVTGRDAQTGRRTWSYQRELDLCTVGSAWSSVIAVYGRSAGCSEVTRLDTGTGRRLAQRNGDAERGTRLVSDGSHVVTTGRHLLNVWGEQLIRAMEYGTLPAPVEPGRQLKPGCAPISPATESESEEETTTPAPTGKRCESPLERQPREGCTFSSVAMAAGKIAVVERCPKDATEWLTVIGTTHNVDGEGKTDTPKVLLSTELPGVGARVVAVARSTQPRAAVVLPNSRQLLIYGPNGKLAKQYGLDLPTEQLQAEQPGRTPQITRGTSSIYWFTGSSTMALDDQTLQPRWTLPGTLGSGVLWAGTTLMPIRGGLAVVDEKTGESSRTIAVNRGGYDGPVSLGYVGPVLLEQRGPELVALR